MTPDNLTTALRACAAGIYTAEAGVTLLISSETFLRRGDFTSRFISHGTGAGTSMAAVDWDAAAAALARGDLSCSGGERRILLMSASLAGGIPSTVTGLDNDNTARLLTAIRHAAGNDLGTADTDNFLQPREGERPSRRRG